MQMDVIGRGHYNRVNGLVHFVEHAAVVGELFGFLEACIGFSCAHGINISDGDDIFFAHVVVAVVSLPADADDGDVEFLICRAGGADCG